VARCPFAEWRPSPNYTGGRPWGVVGAMQHSMASWSFENAITYLCTPRGDASTSAHFGIRGDGHIVQMVDTDDRAWHARDCNGQWIGIEHDDSMAGHADPIRTAALYRASADLNRWLADTHGYDPSEETLRPHRWCVNTACPSGLDVARIILQTGGDTDMPTEAEWQAHLADEFNTATAIKSLLDPIARWVFDAPNRPLGSKATMRKALAMLDRATRPRRRARPPSRRAVRAGHGR
jgi:N-acetylmuramoyl-L-alanine amidase-like protein